MDKRKEKRLEGLKAKAAAQMSPEELAEQRKLSVQQLEIIIPTKEKEIEYLKEMLVSGKVNIKDDTMVDGIAPIFKIEAMIAQTKIQLEEFKKGLKETKELIENDRTKESNKTSTE